MGRVDVDDAAAFLARFPSGATGVFETSRVALGRKNFVHLKVNGSQESPFWRPRILRTCGVRRILVTEELF